MVRLLGVFAVAVLLLTGGVRFQTPTAAPPPPPPTSLASPAAAAAAPSEGVAPLTTKQEEASPANSSYRPLHALIAPYAPSRTVAAPHARCSLQPLTAHHEAGGRLPLDDLTAPYASTSYILHPTSYILTHRHRPSRPPYCPLHPLTHRRCTLRPPYCRLHPLTAVYIPLLPLTPPHRRPPASSSAAGRLSSAPSQSWCASPLATPTPTANPNPNPNPNPNSNPTPNQVSRTVPLRLASMVTGGLDAFQP